MMDTFYQLKTGNLSKNLSRIYMEKILSNNKKNIGIKIIAEKSKTPEEINDELNPLPSELVTKSTASLNEEIERDLLIEDPNEEIKMREPNENCDKE